MKTPRLLWVLGLSLSFGAFQNCARAHFSSSSDDSQLNQTGGYDPAQCSQVLNTTTTPTRLLFVVDESGSNQSSPGTDPNKLFRGGSIQAFFNDYSAKAAFGWGFIGFKGSVATSFINNGNTPVISTSPSAMQNAIQQFESTVDEDSTPYQAALDAVNHLISADNGTPDTNYLVVFLSDGVPNPTIADAALESDIQQILALRPGHVTLSTIYYGPADADASSRLSMMANVGKGNFLDTQANPAAKDFAINNVISIPGQMCVH